jgi:hypothetical protein
MGYKNYCIVSGIFFCLVALAHALRVVYGVAVVVDGNSIPMFASWIAIVVPLLLASWAFRIARGDSS